MADGYIPDYTAALIIATADITTMLAIIGYVTLLNRFQLNLSKQDLIPQIKIASSSRLIPVPLVHSSFGFPFLSFAW